MKYFSWKNQSSTAFDEEVVFLHCWKIGMENFAELQNKKFKKIWIFFGNSRTDEN